MGNGTMHAVRAKQQDIAVDDVDLVPVDLEAFLAYSDGAREDKEEKPQERGRSRARR